MNKLLKISSDKLKLVEYIRDKIDYSEGCLEVMKEHDSDHPSFKHSKKLVVYELCILKFIINDKFDEAKKLMDKYREYICEIMEYISENDIDFTTFQTDETVDTYIKEHGYNEFAKQCKKAYEFFDESINALTKINHILSKFKL